MTRKLLQHNFCKLSKGLQSLIFPPPTSNSKANFNFNKLLLIALFKLLQSKKQKLFKININLQISFVKLPTLEQRWNC